MILSTLIFFVGVWAGVIIGFFLAGAAHAARRADEAERTELDSDDPRITKIYRNGNSKEI